MIKNSTFYFLDSRSSFYFLFSIFYFLFSTATAQAATLYFSPSSGSHTVGSAFSVGVYVSSADQAMNAASGVISFPSDKLEAVSLSKTGSILTLWVQEPSFSNSVGTVNFEGVLFNPGFTGATGQIITINFRAKAAGTALLNFPSGSVLANDGRGTNILTGLGSANFGLRDAVSTVPAGTPPAPKISSLTHPDSNKWYAANDAKFAWPVPSGVTAVRLLLGRMPQAVPTVHYSPAISSKEFPDVGDGVWYFHVRLKNDAGWGATSHFRFQIDTEKPSHFEIREVERDDPTNPRVKFVFDSKDETSGIDYYEVQIDNGSAQVWRDDGSGVYETLALGPGRHTLIAKAIDKAGNSLAKSAEFTIVALEPPIITDYPKTLASGEHLIIRGLTKYPHAQTTVWLEGEGEEAKSQIIRNDDEGKFMFVAEEKLKDGIYKVWAEVMDERGARSTASEKVTISIGQPAFLQLGSGAVSLLAVIIPLVALIILLLAVIYYGWHKFGSFRKKLGKIGKEVYETESALHKAFNLLKDDVREQIKILEKTKAKRELTEEEEKIIQQLKKDLNDAEKYVRKEIEDAKREV
jgi:hypothetical protein